MAKKITEKFIDGLADGIHNFDRGLYLRKRTGKSPSWVFIYTLQKRRTELTIGPAKTVSYSQAQTAANRYRTLLSEGINPLTAKREKQAAMAAPVEVESFTVAELIEEALPVVTEAKRWSNAKHAAQWASTLKTYVVPKIGKLQVRDVKRDDILSVLKPIWTSKTETAGRLRGRLEAVFSYAIVTGKYEGLNPCIWKGNLELFLAPPSKVKTVKHFDAISLDEARELFAKWDPPSSITACAILFGALTCARVGEFIPAQWNEIDMENRVWSCPPERRKDGKPFPHRVPLSDQVMRLLRLLPRETDYLFPSCGGGFHLSKETPRVVIVKKLGHGTMHGFRSTFRDWAAEAGWSNILAEKSLMHATGGVVEQAYQRSDLLEQRRPLLQAWADAVFPNGLADL